MNRALIRISPWALLAISLMGCREAQEPTISADVAGLAQVIDGDSLMVGAVEVRLFGIDAPEYRQTCRRDGKDWACGQAAAAALAEKVKGVKVACAERDKDRYGRVVAECFVAGESLNAWMVREGRALAYRRFSWEFVGQERIAVAKKRGIWGAQFTEPRRWRQHSR